MKDETAPSTADPVAQNDAATYTLAPWLSRPASRRARGWSISGQARNPRVSERVARDGKNIAAELAEILEHHAEHDRYAGGHVAAANARLGDRADKRHAFVLINPRQGRVEALVARLRGRDAVDQVGGIGQVHGLAAGQRPVAGQLRGDVQGQLLALAEHHRLAGGWIGHDIVQLLRRYHQEIGADAQALR